MSKVSFLVRSLINRFMTPVCPSCGSRHFCVIDSKVLHITHLLQCKECNLRYRFPQDSDEFNRNYYNKFYTQKGLTTDLPSLSTLTSLVNSNFRGSEKDFSRFTPILLQLRNVLGRSLNVLDFGANWGYASYQFSKLDFIDKVYSYEVSDARKDFGSQYLGIDYIDDLSSLSGQVDLIFSSHVIEHMHDPSSLRDYSDLVLVENGLLLLVCPNGSDSSKYGQDNSWSKLWGEVHPQYISDVYLMHLFANYNGIVGDPDLLSDSTISNYLNSPLSSLCPKSSELVFLGYKSS